MKQESFKVLEYKRILSRLAEKAGTRLGKELALGLLPVSDSEDVKERLRQTAEAVYVSSTAHPPLGGIKDIRESIKKNWLRGCSGSGRAVGYSDYHVCHAGN